MKIFIDSADIAEIKDAAAMGVVDGVTTNPSLVAKTGRPFERVIRDICEVVDGPISAEVIATTADEIVREGRQIAKIHPNIVVKVPLIADGIRAVKTLAAEGIRTNVTLCFSAPQALLAAKAGATYISPFIGRIDDVGGDGLELIAQIVTIYSNYGYETEVLAASIRHPVHFVRCAEMGADVATLPHKVILQLLSHPLTDIGLAKFLEDAKKIPGDRAVAARKKHRPAGAARVHAPRVLVIYKKSAYQIYVRERRHELIEKLIAAREPSAVRLLRAHREHVRTIEEARRVLERLGAKAAFRHRSDAEQTEACDLVVTLGGDGTLLWGSHLVGRDVPIVAINTAPKDSVGYFCAGSRHQLRDVLSDALSGRLRADTLTRMRAEIDGELVENRVLNDVLFCHECPASTSRYTLSLSGAKEAQKSSGVWVGPAAGSTAAQRSAGGKILPVRSRKLQFVVREPYDPLGQGYRLRSGLVAEHQALEIQSRMRAGRLFIDGPHNFRVVNMASRIRLSRSDEPLTLLGFRALGR